MSESNTVAPRSYRPNIAAMRDRAKQAGDSKHWKMPEGVNRFRILPGWDPNDPIQTFWVDEVLHFGFRSEGSNVAPPCLAAMWGEPCPVCQFGTWLVGHSGADLAKTIRPTVKAYFNVLVRPTNEFKIWSTGQQRRDQIFTLLETPEYGDCLDPEKGRDWIITRVGTGKENTKYPSFMPAPDKSPIGVEGWQAMLTNLTQEFVEQRRTTREAVIKIIYNTYASQYPLDQILA